MTLLTDPLRYGIDSEFQRIAPDARPCRSGLVVVTDVVGEPVTRAQAKTWAKIPTQNTVVDSMIDDLIREGRMEAERRTRKALLSRTLDWTFDGPPSTLIELPVLPASAVLFVKCYDLDNGEQTADPSTYTFDAPTGRILLNNGSVWPVGLRAAASTVVRYVAGYGNAAAVPPQFTGWIKRFVTWAYENPGDSPADFPSGELIGRKTFRL